CMRFSTLRNYFPDELNESTERNFHDNGQIRNYCPDGGSGGKKECKTDLDKIKAGCLWLFEQFFVKSKKQDINIVEYIMMWLSNMLSIKNFEEFKNISEFYNKHIENNPHYIKCDNDGKDCSDSLKKITGCANYNEIINKKKDLLNISIENMSKFYDAFKLLCSMYTELNANDTKNKKYLENANEFVKKYDKLNDPNNTKDNTYYHILSTLSNDYNNFKNYCKDNEVDCNDIPSISPIKTQKNGVRSSAHNHVQNSEVTPSSPSVVSKLIPVLSIIVAIPIFLGIFYKYSLFGFRKRSQKQHLREKIKK
ncbi:putative yir1 protein, partial [Plasmodium yoelii yoelii]